MNGWWPYGHGGLLPAPRRLASLALRRSGSSRLPPCGQKRPPAFATRPPQQRRPSSPKQPLWLRRPGCRCGGWKPAPACAKPEPRFGQGRPAGEGRPGGGSFGEGRPPQRPASGFQIPRTPIIGFQGPPLVGIKTPLWPLSFTCVVHVATARNFLPCAGPLHPRLARSLRENSRRPRRPGRPSSPLRHQPRPPGCRFLELPQAPYEGLYVVQALFLPGLQGFGRRRRGGREARPGPALSRTWISPGRPYPLGSGRRSPAYPSGRPANSQFGSQIGNALANWSAGARRRSQETMTPAPRYCN